MYQTTFSKQLNAITGSLRAYLTGLLCVALMHTGQAQSCELPGFVPPDTLLVAQELGDCFISTSEILDSLGLLNCAQVQLIPSGPYEAGITRNIVVYDRDKDSIYSPFVLIPSIRPLAEIPQVTTDTNGISILDFPLGAGECAATKDMVLDQLGVVNDIVIRSQIHLLSGSQRITDFSIGDTTRIDQITCDGVLFYEDLDIVFTPSSGTFTGLMTFDIGFTTCQLGIEDVLLRLGYTTATCPLENFRISDTGPFGYGQHFIDYISLDGFDILRNVIINVVPSNCILNGITFGMLPQGKCVLNEYDIIERIGLADTGCSTDGVRLEPSGPYATSPVTITNVFIDDYEVCNLPFEVTFDRDSLTQEQGAIFCHQDLNIAMGPECEIPMNADIILSNNENYCFLNYIIDLSWASDPETIIQSGHEVTITQPGRYSLTITNPTTGNSCWAEFQVEDKFIEDYRCEPDTVVCYQTLNLVPDDTIGGGPDFPDLGAGVVFSPTASERSYDVSMATLCDVAFASYEDELVDYCTNGFKEIIDRTWTFVDNFGNTDTCIQKIYVRNSTVNQVDFFQPIQVDCIDDFEILDSNGHPDPQSSGFPSITDSLSGNQIDAGICGTLKMTYTDAAFPLCGNGMKIVRRWVIIDWCSDQVLERDQVIRIEDEEAPVLLDSLDHLYIDSDPFICGGTNIDLPLPNYEDCNENIDLEIIYETYNEQGILIKKSNGASLLISEILTFDIVSTFSVEYILSDPCGNETRDTLLITITDNEPPVAVCDEYTVISVSGNGNASILAETFDDLSVDNCGIASYEARKLEGFCDVTNVFTDRIRFCCEEVGDTLLVEFRVTDLAGNENTCEVLVHIQDKFRPILTCPDDITLDCGEDFMDVTITGEPSARDNCSPIDITFDDENNLNQCYQGTITRTWTVMDKGGFVVSCEQTIVVVEDTLFSVDNVIFPPDTVVMGCNAPLEPEHVGEPIINSKSCAMVDATFTDLFFYDTENACVKILREWTIIDWCQRDQSNSGIWKMDQIIKLISDEGPVFENEDLEDTYCIVSTDCQTDVTISGLAVDGDNCTPADELNWNYSLFSQSSGLIDLGEGRTVESTLAQGSYFIIYEATDGCDNMARDTFYFEVVDCTAPTLSCPDVQPSKVLSNLGEAILSIDEIVDFSVADNCDQPLEIELSFEKDRDMDQIRFTCADLVDGLFQGFIKLYASDQAGNIDSCDLYVEIRDNSDNICGSGDPMDTLSMTGMITTRENVSVEAVQVSLFQESNRVNTMETTDGSFSFDRLTPGANYTVKFEKDTGHDDGVSTLDLVLTQRHILGLKEFESPYQVIAADADNSGHVSTIDLVRMRRLVLGLDSELNANGQESWRFVSADQEFDNMFRPFPFTDEWVIQPLTASMNNGDFMAIKIGDVNGSNSISSRIKSFGRSERTPILVDHKEGSVQLIAPETTDLSGLQLRFHIEDPMSIGAVHSDLLEIGLDHYSITDDELIISWISEDAAIKIVEGTVLLSIEIASDISLKEIVEGFQIQKSEWIEDDLTASKVRLELLEEQLEMNSSAHFISEVVNAPNPFTEYTRLQFNSRGEGPLLLEVFDLNGQRVFFKEVQVTAGQNELTIHSSDMNDLAGVYFARLSMGDHRVLHKLTFVR